MSNLRPECRTYYGDKTSLPTDTALFLIRDAVARRRSLIHGQLHRGNYHCALGCFWHDNPGTILETDLIDEVAAVNDSMKGATAHQRWKKVNSWLRWKLKVLATGEET